MRRRDREELVRLLVGELPPARAAALRERLGREAELAAAFRRLEAAWRSAEAPPGEPVPPGFTREVMARVRREGARGAEVSWSLAPVWVRAAGAAALAAGVLMGVGLEVARQSGGGAAVPPAAVGSETASGAAAITDESPALLAPSLAEEYLQAVAGEGEQGESAEPPSGGGAS
jgi:anti-sigma factor RsiW